MGELLVLTVAGLLFGAGLGAARNRAPRPLLLLCWTGAAVALLLTVLLLATD